MSTGIGESRPSCCEGPTLLLPVMDEARRAKARGPKGPERGYGFLGKGQLAGAKFGGPIPPPPAPFKSVYVLGRPIHMSGRAGFKGRGANWAAAQGLHNYGASTQKQ